ncbi:MAG: DrmB family protein [Phycisphaerae bacterium]
MTTTRPQWPESQLRQRQLITTFGPGAMLDLPRCSVIIAGLEFWRLDRSGAMEIDEPRLASTVAKFLNVPSLRLYAPPEHEDHNQNSTSGVRAFIFPEWFLAEIDRTLTTGEQNLGARRLVHLRDLENGKLKIEGGKKLDTTPVRFVCACPRGHISDIDWGYFVHQGKSDCQRPLWVNEYGASTDLSAIEIRCECGARRSMIDAATPGALGNCGGQRPWLGGQKYEACSNKNRLLIRSASNTYLPMPFSVISLPTKNEGLAAAVSQVWRDILESVDCPEDLEYEMRKKPRAKAVLADYSAEQIMEEIKRRKASSSAAPAAIKEEEFRILTNSPEGIFTDTPHGNFIARALPRKHWDQPWMQPIERVVLIHRLREVIALTGFTRFESAGVDMDGELQIGVTPAALASEVTWIPAVENPGEGVFIQFRREAIQTWLKNDAVQKQQQKLESGFSIWKQEHNVSGRIFPGAAYIMLHSLAHLLITEISLECGYSSSAIRERIYGSERTGYGILLYTGSSDSEGTLGGLVEAGRRIAQQVHNALEAGKLCSNDPVCAQHNPQNREFQRYLQGAACHGCLLISETCCEQFNDFLDRSLVVPTVEQLGAEFFHV